MEGVNGIQAARALRDKKEEALLIFITGFKEYVFEAFDVAAFHYLLKPVEEKNLRRYLPKPWQRWGGVLSYQVKGQNDSFKPEGYPLPGKPGSNPKGM